MNDGIGSITDATRTFLSRNRLYPGHVWRELAEGRSRSSRDWSEDRRLGLQGPSIWGWIDDCGPDDAAALSYDATSGRVLLEARRPAYLYRELRSGVARILLIGRSLPDTVCMGLPAGGLPLSRIVQFSSDYFFVRSDPLVTSMANGSLTGRQGLKLTVRPTWSKDNWNYYFGQDRWRE